ncbi:MAG: 50S ribosomal protein L9 [Acidobacteriota bacterium]
MKVILRQNVEKLGKQGETVSVKDGYARNFLFPKKLALPATPQNLRFIDQEKRRVAVKEIKEKTEAEALASKLSQISLTVIKKVGENDILYGSVTAAEISDLLKREGIEIDKRKIEIEEPIKTLGIFTVPVKVHQDVTAEVKVWIVKE